MLKRGIWVESVHDMTIKHVSEGVRALWQGGCAKAKQARVLFSGVRYAGALHLDVLHSIRAQHPSTKALLMGTSNALFKGVSVLMCGAIFSAGAMANTGIGQSTEYAQEREWFIEARKALGQGNRALYEQRQQQLQNYPLSNYLNYIGLAQRFRTEKPGAEQLELLSAFEQSSNDDSLTRKLTRSLQQRFADTQQWSQFLKLKSSRFAAGMPCTTLRARVESGEVTSLADEAALTLWVKPVKHPAICAAAIDELEAAKVPPVKAIWERIFASMEKDRPQYAKPMLRYLSTADRKRVSDWINALKSPKKFLTSGVLKDDTMLNRRILVDLVLAWSKEEPVPAMRHWLEVYPAYGFFKDRYYDTHRLLAMRGAYRRLPEAYEWLHTLEPREDDLELEEWRIRAALFEQDWVNVLRSIKRLPLEEQQEDHWAYWEARALEESGHLPQARVIYTELSSLPTYHGFLSADKMGVPYAIVDEPIEVDETRLAPLRSNEQLIRAREYYAVNIPWEGRREWNRVVSDTPIEQLAALAVLASDWKMDDRAITTAYKAEKKRALSIRFPVLYQSEVELAAAKNRIDPAWIFGVMRRESAYIRDVKSSAGAVGLMQLMPRTAKYVAELQGDKNWKGDLTNADTNIDFGSFYLRHVMDKFDDHQILATASYNAGPKRVGIWLPEADMSADVWIDAIPYTETRRYVRAVMAYTTIYEWHLTKEPRRLSDKLLPVPAAPDT